MVIGLPLIMRRARLLLRKYQTKSPEGIRIPELADALKEALVSSTGLTGHETREGRMLGFAAQSEGDNLSTCFVEWPMMDALGHRTGGDIALASFQAFVGLSMMSCPSSQTSQADL
jgi:hypothetical protein